MNDEENGYSGWSVLELMGHRRLVGFVTETKLAGAPVLRIDVPRPEDPLDAGVEVTQFYAPSALYCLTPATEDAVRAELKRQAEYRRPAGVLTVRAGRYGDDEEYGDYDVEHIDREPDGDDDEVREDGIEPIAAVPF